ncbi:MAG TPA: outer membrane protein assembly factor BamA [Chthoniobacterales bacterium]|nr:outer membrane protein assembly factor BamA [Chthoniobacterales bacterium]
MRLIRRPLRSPAFSFSVAIAFVLFATSARTQNPVAETPPIIRSIDVQYSGPATISKERILAQIRTRIGRPYSEEVVNEDIKNLYKTGAVLNVRIFAQPQADGVKVIVAVQTRSVVREIVIDGAQAVKPRRIRKAIPVKINSMVKEEDLEKGREDIIDIYRAKGFNEADVQFRVEPIEEKRGTARVVYTINEGVKGAVSRINFEGNQHFSDRTLRKQLKTRGKTLFYYLDKSGRLDEAQFQQDLDSVREFYQNHGYIDVELKDVRRQRADGRMTITIVVNEGTQYHVGKISISGEKVTTEEKIRALLKMKEGSVYSPKALHDDAKAMADAYGSGGYVDLVITPQGTPGGPGVIDLHYQIEEGARSFIQRINVVGNTRTKDKVIRREVLVTPGDIFNTVRVETSKKRLENLGYFSKVETYPEDTGVPGRKDLTIEVQEKRTGSLSFGGGFSSIDKLVGFVELTQGNFDVTNWPVLTGAGQKFRIRVQVGTERKDALISFTEPWLFDQPLSLTGQAFFNESNYLSSYYDQRDYGFMVELRKPLNPFIYSSLAYRLEDFDIYNVDPLASAALELEKGSTVKSEVLAGLVWDRRDNPFLTRSGQRIAVTPYVAGGFLGGDVQIYGWDVEASQYFHLWWDNILLFNVEAATVNTWGSGDRVPIFDRLFLGGANNLRGFQFRDVGPKDVNDEPLGGKTLARATVEYTFPIVEKARGAIFYDTGFDNPDAYDFSVGTQTKPRRDPARPPLEYNNLASDIGVGIRLDLPIGPLRLDYGIPIQRAGNNYGGQFNFSVGYQF